MEPPQELPDPLEVLPLAGPPDASVSLPGSKSITNRALVCAALADGTSVVTGALWSDDTEAMLDCLARLGVRVEVDAPGGMTDPVRMVVHGVGGELRGDAAVLDARMSGTTSRFIAPVALLSGAVAVLDGAPSLRARPMADLWDALGQLGARVDPLGVPGHLPVEIQGGPGGVQGGAVVVRGDVSSQFLSGLLLAAPAMARGLEVRIEGPLVSAPYVEMTVAVMRSFGAEVSVTDPGAGPTSVTVAGSGYRAVGYPVEPDASTASYFLALAAVTGGRIRIEGLGSGSLQGDLGSARVLERMGAEVAITAGYTEVRGTGVLEGIDIDMVDISDTAPTLGAIAPLASDRVRVGGIGFVRGKETDRIAAVVGELRRLGIDAEALQDGFVVNPGRPVAGVVATHQDHRMAMSFAVLGLATGGIRIAEPRVVEKTFPGFWTEVERVRETVPRRRTP